MHNFKIVMRGPGIGEVWLDGEKLEGVTAVGFHAEAGQANTVSLTFVANSVEIEGEAEVFRYD